MKHGYYLSVLFFMLFSFFLCIGNAHAYIDPGTGSMILQALLAGAVAVLAFGKQIYGYLYGIFHRRQSEEGTTATKDDTKNRA